MDIAETGERNKCQINRTEEEGDGDDIHREFDDEPMGVTGGPASNGKGTPPPDNVEKQDYIANLAFLCLQQFFWYQPNVPENLLGPGWTYDQDHGGFAFQIGQASRDWESLGWFWTFKVWGSKLVY